MIKVSVIGNVGSDCVIKEANGSKFGTFRVAHTSSVKTSDGQKKDETIWVDVVINNVEWAVIPYIKRGVKIYVSGAAKLRLYSSPKDKCMKAGLTINATDIQLCGGSSDDVPRHLVNPSDGALVEVQKFYHVDLDNSAMKKGQVVDLYDPHGGRYQANYGGWVSRAQDEEPKEEVTE